MFVLKFGQLKINGYINIEIYQYSVYHVQFMLENNIMFKNTTREHTLYNSYHNINSDPFALHTIQYEILA